MWCGQRPLSQKHCHMKEEMTENWQWKRHMRQLGCIHQQPEHDPLRVYCFASALLKFKNMIGTTFNIYYYCCYYYSFLSLIYIFLNISSINFILSNFCSKFERVLGHRGQVLCTPQKPSGLEGWGHRSNRPHILPYRMSLSGQKKTTFATK